MTTYNHKAIIQKDGEIVLEVNLESEPHAITSMACKFINELYQKWQSEHQYIKFANDNELKKVYFGIPEFTYQQLKQGIQVDCVEIRYAETFFNDKWITAYRTYFKEPNKVVETYTKEQMIQCYKDAKAMYYSGVPLTAEQYLNSLG